MKEHLHSRRPKGARQEEGFTLIEIMAVVVIMGLLMTLVGGAVFQQVDKARVTTAKAKIAQMNVKPRRLRLDDEIPLLLS